MTNSLNPARARAEAVFRRMVVTPEAKLDARPMVRFSHSVN